MRIESSATLQSVGAITEKNNFKSCIVRVETPPLKDPETEEVIRQPELFDCEVAIRDTQTHTSLVSLMTEKKLLKCIFNLRSFFYQEKGVQKLGRGLQLKKWS